MASRSRLVRWLALVATVLALAAVAVWQLHDRMLARALAEAVAASGGRLVVEGVAGTFGRGLRVARLGWHDPAGVWVDVDGLRLRWRWADLVRGRVVLASVQAERLVLRPGADGPPPGLPESIALPMPFAVRAARVDRVRIERAGAAPLDFDAVTLRADYDGTRGSWRIERLSMRTPWGSLVASGSLEDRAPLQLRATASATADWRGLRLSAAASGPLAEFALRVEARPADGGPTAESVLKASTVLRPFAARPLDTVSLQLRGLLPAQLGLARPTVGIFDGEGDLDWRPDALEGGLRLRVALRNRAPAPLDRGGVPLAALRARLAWQDGVWRADELLAQVGGTSGSEGLIVGSLGIDSGRPLSTPWGRVPRLQAALRIDAVSPQTLDTRLPAGRLGGGVSLEERRFDIDLGDASRGGATLRARGVLSGESVEIAESRLAGLPLLDGAVVQASGSLQAVAPWAFDLQGRVDGFSLATLAMLQPRLAHPALRGRLDARWRASGEPGHDARPRTAALAVLIERGTLQDTPLRGRLEARLSGERLQGIDASLEHGPNRLRLAGDAGAPGDRLDWQLDAARLGLLARLAGQSGVDGALQARGSWRGTPDDPDLSVTAQGSALRVADIAVGRLSLEARLARDRVQLRADSFALQQGERRLEQASVEAEGTLADHRLRGALRQGPHQAALLLRGGWSASRWQGRLAEFSLRGPLTLRLREPAELEFAAGTARLGALVVEGDAGVLRLDELALAQGRWRLAARASLQRLARAAEALGFERPVPAAEFDLDQLAVEVVARLEGSSPADLVGSAALTVKAPPGMPGAVEARITLREGELGGTIDAALPTLAVVNRWIGPEWSVDGRLVLSGVLAGTLAAPRLTGEVRGEALRLEQRSLGWRLGAGSLRARFDGDSLRLERLRLHAGQPAIAAAARRELGGPDDASELPAGALDLDGVLRGADRSGRFRLRARAVTVPFGPGQKLVMSGEADVASQAGRFELKGRVRADEGLIELRGGEAPTLPADVEILRLAALPAPGAPGASSAASARAGRATGDASLRVLADLAIDLGERLRVRGSGVDARLAGTLQLRGTLPAAPHATGTVTVREGTYSAYGQKLQIERGRLDFSGPIDNPSLDILAMRQNLPVQAGVAVTGTVLSPRVRLASRPEMSDAERLSWLVLGAAPDSAQAGAQSAALQAAAATLFGRNDGGLASALGLDVLTVRSAGILDPFSPSAALTGFGTPGLLPGQAAGASTVTPTLASQNVVAVGKRLSSKVLLTYEQGLRGVWNLLRIQYELSDRLSVRAQTGSESAIDLLWRLSFD